MDFDRKYELLEALPGEGAKSFRGRQAASGRCVCVHLLPGGHSPANDALLARIRALPPESLMQLIEVGEHDGAIFAVTDAPPYESLMEWIQEQERAAAERRKLSRGGAWKIPVAPPQPPAAPAPAQAATAGSGEATREFEIPAGFANFDEATSPGAPATETTRQMPAAAKMPATGEAITREMPISTIPSAAAESTRQMPAVAKPSAEATTRQMPAAIISSSATEATRQMPAARTPLSAEAITREMPITPIPSAADATRQMPVTTRFTPPPDKSGEATRVFPSVEPADPGPATAATPQIPEPEKPWFHRALRKLFDLRKT